MTGCPEGRFECGPACVDLLSDAENCGSCDHRCADDWPADLTALGLTFDDANIQAICAQAECTFVCAEREVGARDLLESVADCGACGRACEAAVVNRTGSTCLRGTCGCTLSVDGVEQDGHICGDRCVLAGSANVGADGCYPTLASGPNRVVADAQRRTTQHVFEASGETGLRVAGFDCGQRTLLRYLDDGTVATVHSDVACGEIHEPLLPAGHYGLVTGGLGAGEFEAAFPPAAPDVVSPGIIERASSANVGHAFFRAPRAGHYFMRSTVEGCVDRVRARLRDMTGRVVAEMGASDDCRGRAFEGYWDGQLSAGIYLVETRGRALGEFMLRVAGPDPDLPPGSITRPGIHAYPGFAAAERESAASVAPVGGTFTFTTAGPNGEGCAGNTVLRMGIPAPPFGLNGLQINDDHPNVPDGCSRITYPMAPEVEHAVIVSGWEDGALGPFSIIVQHQVFAP